MDALPQTTGLPGAEGVATTCPYCGVGCGVIAQPDGSVVGDKTHPANYGRLCSKGAALAETIRDEGRLLYPVIEGERASWDTALDLIAKRFRETAAEHGPDSVAFYVSGQCLTEDYYVANKLMKGFMGSANIDTNSRLCMSSAVSGHIRGIGADVMPSTYEDLEEADLVVLVGSNLAWCHPVLFQRMQAARARRGTKLVVIDPRRTATCAEADLHLPVAPGSDVARVNGLLAHLEQAGCLDQAWAGAHTNGLNETLEAARGVDVAGITGLGPEVIDTFYQWFAAAERTVTVYSQGVNQSSAGTDKVNAILNVHFATGRIGKPGSGPFSVTGQPNAMGGREAGGLSSTLAAHMRFDTRGAADSVRRFWSAPNLATRPGLKAVDMFEAVHDGRVKAIWIICTNPADSMPNAGRVREALDRCPFVVVSDIWPTDTTRHARVVLPAAGWGERSGTVTNSERRISRQRPFRAPPGEARPDWWMLSQVGRRMGFGAGFAYNSAADVLPEHANLTAIDKNNIRPLNLGSLAGLSDDEYAAMPPQQWPIRPTGENGGRLFAGGGFPTPDGRAVLVPTRWRAPASLPDAEFPFTLITGRVRDQWHTMTRTGVVPRLVQHVAEPLAAFHPEDAAALGIEAGSLVRLETAQGATVLRATIEAGQRRGDVFVPIHWTDAFSSMGPIGRLVTPARDPISGQPEMKATPLRATAVPTVWRGLLLHANAVRPTGCTWSRIPLDHGHTFELAGAEALPAGDALAHFAKTMMAADGADIMEMTDPARGVWRYAALREGRLQSCIYLASGTAKLPSYAALAALMAGPVEDAARVTVLSGGGTVQAAEKNVCACFSVGLETIRAAIVGQHLASVAAIGVALKAGTNCGSCIPELREILREQMADA